MCGKPLRLTISKWNITGTKMCQETKEFEFAVLKLKKPDDQSD